MKAIIDLGTNTFHLLIAEVVDGKVIEHQKLQIPVKLGEGGINRQTIAPGAFQRGLNALQLFRNTLNNYGIEQAEAHGTSALRDADNGALFIEQAHDLYKINIKLISGEEEAAIIYNGVKHSFLLPNQTVLVMDIGGGSVEFIIGKQDQIFWKKSYPIGAARLVERFHLHDPIADEEIVSLQSYLVHNIVDLRDALKEFPTNILIGSAGSFETLRDVLKQDLKKGVLPISPYADEIDVDAFDEYARYIPSLSKAERAKLNGMVDFRVEMIVVATIMMDVIVKRFKMTRIFASNFSLKEGILFG